MNLIRLQYNVNDINLPVLIASSSKMALSQLTNLCGFSNWIFRIEEPNLRIKFVRWSFCNHFCILSHMKTDCSNTCVSVCHILLVTYRWYPCACVFRNRVQSLRNAKPNLCGAVASDSHHTYIGLQHESESKTFFSDAMLLASLAYFQIIDQRNVTSTCFFNVVLKPIERQTNHRRWFIVDGILLEWGNHNYFDYYSYYQLVRSLKGW